MIKTTSSIRLILWTIVLGTGFLNAGDSSSSSIHWGLIIMGLFGGLSLFLYGMAKMSDGMKKAAGDRMRNILAALTRNRVIGMFVGAFVTMIVQSSSATTVMLVSFVQAQLMTYAQAISIILGANIGTTITAQLVAFKLTDYALLMITVGFTMTMFAKKDSIKHIGEAILGFGILFFGMKLMSDSMKPLRTFEPFINIMKGMESPMIGLFIGAVFTALIQSSSAFTGIVIVLAQQGLLTLEAGIPLIFGANIGTCITAGLASIGTIRDAKRVAIAHVFFNIGGVLVFVLFIPQLAEVVRWLSPVSEGTGAVKLAMESPRQIANAHTIFNISVGLVFLPFTTILAHYVYKVLPDKKIEKGTIPVTWHLDDDVISTPRLALDLARSEISRMAKILGRMLDVIIEPFIATNEQLQDKIYPEFSLVEGVEIREEKLDYLDRKITKYLRKIGQQELSENQIQEVYGFMSIVNDIESIGDTIDKNMIPLLAKKDSLNMDFSPEGKEELSIYHNKVCKQINRLKKAFSKLDPGKAEKIIHKEGKYSALETKYRINHLERLHQEREESIETHEIHMELMDMLKQINVYSGEIAKTIHSLGNKI